MECVTSNSWLEFRGESDRDAGSRKLKGIFTTAGRGKFLKIFADNLRNCRRILMNLRGVISHQH